MKHKVFHYLMRIIPLALVCCMFIFILSPSASAASVSYQDFDPQIVVDGDANLITIDIPVDYYKLGLRDGNLNTLGSWSGVDSFTYHITNGEQYSILFTIFQNGVPFSLTDIPNGTVFNVDFSVTTIASFFEDGVGFQTEYWWYDASGATVSWEYHNESPKGYNGLYSFSFPVSKRNGITSFSFGGTYYPAPCISPYDMRFSLDSVQMQFSISNFYLLQQSNQQTHALLDEVNRQLAEQGKSMQDILNQQQQTNDKLDSIQGEQEQTNEKLDDIINGEVDPETPEGADKIDDLDNAEGQLREEAQAGLDQGVEIQQNVLQILEEFANGFAVFSWIFGLFAKQPFISGLLYVSVSLGTVGALLNLGLSAAKSSGSRSAKAAKAGKGG